MKIPIAIHHSTRVRVLYNHVPEVYARILIDSPTLFFSSIPWLGEEDKWIGGVLGPGLVD